MVLRVDNDLDVQAARALVPALAKLTRITNLNLRCRSACAGEHVWSSDASGLRCEQTTGCAWRERRRWHQR